MKSEKRVKEVKCTEEIKNQVHFYTQTAVRYQLKTNDYQSEKERKKDQGCVEEKKRG